MGRVTRRPNSVGEGNQEVTFTTLVTKRFYESKGEILEDPHVHTLMVSNKNPAVHNYVKGRVHKGDRVYVEGTLRYTTRETKDGKMKKEPTIHVEDLITVAGAY